MQRQIQTKLVKATHRFEQQERVEQERGAARNALETWVYAMRAALEGPHKTDLDPSAVNATCDRVEDWLWADGADATAEGFATKLADERRAFEEAFPQFCVAEREAAAAKLRREEEEEEALTRAAAEEAASGEKDDHDNRVLKFSDRYALAEKNKVEGTELFKGGNFQPAAQRYIKALGHLAKLVHVEASMREEEHEQARALRVGCYNNLAMCFLKLELWAKAKDNASHVVELEVDLGLGLSRMKLLFCRTHVSGRFLRDSVCISPPIARRSSGARRRRCSCASLTSPSPTSCSASRSSPPTLLWSSSRHRCVACRVMTA